MKGREREKSWFFILFFCRCSRARVLLDPPSPCRLLICACGGDGVCVRGAAVDRNKKNEVTPPSPLPPPAFPPLPAHKKK